MKNHLPSVAERFLRYVQIDTQSDPTSDTVPSTEKQKDLGRLLVEELNAMGNVDAHMDSHGYVFATMHAKGERERNTDLVLGLLAHLDTSPDESGKDVRPIIHPNYNGEIIALPGDPTVTLDPSQQPALLNHLGQDIITSDGTTLLGSDDKAGVAILMQLVEDLISDNSHLHPTIRICFTIDEEIGRGVDHLDLEKFGAHVAYTIDGSGMYNIFTETFNAVQAAISVKGIMVHPGYAKGVMVNAVRILSEMITALPAHEAPESTSGREGFIHPHTISSNDASQAESLLILRDFSIDGIQTKIEYLQTLVSFFRAKYPRATIDLTFKDQYKNMRSYIEQKDQRVVSMAYRAAERMGIKLEDHVIRGGTDGARLSELGIPTPNIFNGGHDYHSRFEWNTVQNLEQSLDFVKYLVIQWGQETL